LTATGLVEESLKIVHASPVECLSGVLNLICASLGADYGLILTVDQHKQALLVDVLQGYADEQTTAYRSERIKLPIDESQSVAAKALAAAKRESKPVAVIRQGDDPINYEIAPVEETVACAVGSLGEFDSVLVLERKKNSSRPPFSALSDLERRIHTCVQLISIALAARQSFVFKFDEFMKQSSFQNVDRMATEVVRWVFEKFGVASCGLYFVDYEPNEGCDYLVRRERIVNGVQDAKGDQVKLGWGQDYAGWIAANNSSLMSFADSHHQLHITAGNLSSGAGLPPTGSIAAAADIPNFKSYLGAPITDGKQVIGVLEVVGTEREYSYSDEELLEMIADRIGSEYLRISRDERRESLFDIPNIETRDLRLVIQGVVDAAMKVAAATHGLFMFKRDDGYFEPRAVRGYGLEKKAIEPVKVGHDDLTNWVINSDGKPAFVSGDITTSHEFDAGMSRYIENTRAPRGFIPPQIRSVLMVPIYLKDTATDHVDDLGVLVLLSLRSNAFQRDEVVITALGEIVSYHIWANKKSAELETTSEKVEQLEQAMPNYNKAAIAAAASAGSVHTANKHVKDLAELIKTFINHPKVRESRDLLRDARIIETQFSELTDLYSKLLHVFSGSENESEPSFEPCDLAELLQEVRSYMEPKFRERHIAFKSQVKDAALLKVNLDPVLMKVVFINLINNSIDASAREISVSARKTTMDMVGDSIEAVEMLFKDNGSGIQPEDVDNVFKLFFTKNKRDGTGLGLAVNRDILDKHGGTIRVVSSEPGQGTVFSLKWPMNP
jgi:signal transduction histidine kinase